MRGGAVTKCNEEVEMKEEDMIMSIIPVFPVGGEASMFVSTTSSRHMARTNALLELEVTDGECKMISGLRCRMLTFPILIGVIPMTGWVGPNISSMSTRC